jgi:hypothetical protein
MPAPTPGQPDTLTDIYDRLRLRRRATRTLGAVLAALVLAALAACAPGLPTEVCGTIATVPIRVEDSVCGRTNALRSPTPIDTGAGWVRWYAADRRCLDADDVTRIGDSLDDDYLGEPCDAKPAKATTRPSSTTARPTTTRTAPPTTTRAAVRTTTTRAAA